MTINHWDITHIRLARTLATASKDPSTKVGARIVDPYQRVVSEGFNGFPRKVKDTADRLNDRDTRLSLTQHAERNAIAFATQSLNGCTLYVWPLPPCAQCAGALIQAGVTRIVTPEFSDDFRLWRKDYDLSLEMYEESGVQVDYYMLHKIS